MKIGVISIHDQAYEPVANITVSNLTQYCIRHGYNHHIYRSCVGGRDIVWERIPRILERLPQYDWVVYFDSDVLVTNHFVKLEEFLDKEIVLSENIREDGSVHLNDGVLFVKNSEIAVQILKFAWDKFGQKNIFCAQDAIEDLGNNDECWDFPSISVERQKRFNSFLYTEYGMPETTKGHWTVGDFALHLPGRTNERRVEIFSKTPILK